MRFDGEISGKIKTSNFFLMDQSRPVESTVVGRPRFWVGPLVVGCCFAMGFGVTNRVVSLQGERKPAQTQRFAPSYFPGDSMQNLRSIHQGDSNVQVDLATRNPASPDLDAAVMPLDATALETSLASQLPLAEERPWTAPTWSDPDADPVPTATSTKLIPDLDPTPAPASALLAPPPEVLYPSFVSENDAQQLLPLQLLRPPSLP
jgi:hypothetical protein